MTLSWYDKVFILQSWVECNVLKILHSIQLSIEVSLAISITCFHSIMNNLTLLCSVLVVQSQNPLHVLIVWQKTSLRCAQSQFFNPKSHYMYPMDYKVLNSIQPSMQKPHIEFMCESTLEGDGLTLSILFTTTTICTPLISHGALPVEHLNSHWGLQ